MKFGQVKIKNKRKSKCRDMARIRSKFGFIEGGAMTESLGSRKIHTGCTLVRKGPGENTDLVGI